MSVVVNSAEAVEAFSTGTDCPRLRLPSLSKVLQAQPRSAGVGSQGVVAVKISRSLPEWT